MSADKEFISETIGMIERLQYMYPLDSRRRYIFFRRVRRYLDEWERTGRLSPAGVEQLNRLFRSLEVIGPPIPSELMERIERISSLGIKERYDLLKKEIEKKIQEKGGRKTRVVIMLGSGASRPPPSNIPTVDEMLGYLINNLPPTEIPFASQMKEWATINGVNIEDILTAGYLGTLLVSKSVVNRLVGEIIYRESEERSLELREREYVFSFQDLVKRVFSMVSGMMAKADSNKVHESIARMMKNLNNGLFDFSIATTNYDVCIEKAFEKGRIPYTYLGINGGESEKGIPIIKIHGSINWFYCEGCQSVITYSIRELEKFDKIFPTSGSCQKCGTSASLFMVPPIAYKYVMFPPLIDIWQSAMSTIEAADIIVVVGYSFSLADDYIFKMIVSGVKKRNSILVVLNRDNESIRNLESKLSAHHLKLSYPFLDDAVNSVPEIAKVFEGATIKPNTKSSQS